jgi:hypothetical protein
LFSKGEKWYDKLFNVKYLPLFHHFKAIYQFPKHIIFWVKIVANASLTEHNVTKSLQTYNHDNLQIETINLYISGSIHKLYMFTRVISPYQKVSGQIQNSKSKKWLKYSICI